MGLHEDVRRPIGGHAEAPGGLDEGREDLVREAVGLDPPVYDLDEDAMEDGPVEQLAQVGVCLFVGLAGFAEQGQRVVEGLHDVIDLGDGLALPALDLGLFGGDALLLGLHDLDGDGVAVVELDELLLLGGQLAQSAAVTFGFGFGGGGLGGDELPDGGAQGLLLLGVEPGMVV